MDISTIDASKVTLTDGIQIGSDSAPKKMIEFVNLRCPYCKRWFQESAALLEEAVHKQQVQRIIKLFNKEKESLQRGNVMHLYVSQNDSQQALKDMAKIFDTQDQWGDLSLEEVAQFAEETLQLTKQEPSKKLISIVEEAEAANIKFVPTVIVEQHIFDESVTKEELLDYLEL